MNPQYNYLSRTAFRAGLSALRGRLRQLTETQCTLKTILHKPHTTETWSTQAALATGKGQITATLNVYLHVRGKAQIDKTGQPVHRIDKFDASLYQYNLRNANHVFDEAAEICQTAVVQGGILV